jgi:hypothetical protein
LTYYFFYLSTEVVKAEASDLGSHYTGKNVVNKVHSPFSRVLGRDSAAGPLLLLGVPGGKKWWFIGK